MFFYEVTESGGLASQLPCVHNGKKGYTAAAATTTTTTTTITTDNTATITDLRWYLLTLTLKIGGESSTENLLHIYYRLATSKS